MADTSVVPTDAVALVEKKEELTSKMDDAAILAQIKKWEDESETVYAQLKRVWEENLDYYHGRQTDVHLIYGRQSKAVENRGFMATETMIPIATARLPDIVVKPGVDDEQGIIEAQELQDVLGYQMERVHIQDLAERFLRDMIIKRYGVWKYDWDQPLDDVKVTQVDAKRVRIPKFGRTIDELKYVLEDLELSYDAAVEYFGKETAAKLLKTPGKETEDQVRKKKTFAVLEVTTNDYKCWKYGSIILAKKENPYYDFKDPSRNYFDKPQKNYIIKSLFHTAESLLGDTDYFQATKSIQDNINIRKRQIENITNKVANPPLLIDSSVMSEEDAANITNDEGQIIYGRGAADGTKIRFESPGQVPAYLFEDLNESRKAFDNIWGLHSTSRGEREGRETLGGRQLLREADFGRIDGVARQLERALDELGEGWTQLIKLFYTEKKAFTIMGEDGARFVKDFTGDKIKSGVKPQIKPGSTIKEDEFSLKQQAIILWQNKAIGLKTLYKMLRIPNMQQALQDYQETFAQAAGAAPGSVPPVA